MKSFTSAIAGGDQCDADRSITYGAYLSRTSRRPRVPMLAFVPNGEAQLALDEFENRQDAESLTVLVENVYKWVRGIDGETRILALAGVLLVLEQSLRTLHDPATLLVAEHLALFQSRRKWAQRSLDRLLTTAKLSQSELRQWQKDFSTWEEGRLSKLVTAIKARYKASAHFEIATRLWNDRIQGLSDEWTLILDVPLVGASLGGAEEGWYREGVGTTIVEVLSPRLRAERGTETRLYPGRVVLARDSD